MTMAIDRGRFIDEYRRAIPEVMWFVTREHQELIARHNASGTPIFSGSIPISKPPRRAISAWPTTSPLLLAFIRRAQIA